MFTLPIRSAAILCLVMLVGCADKAHETGFLSDYSKLEPVQGKDNLMVYLAPADQLRGYTGLIVDPIQVKFYDEEKSSNVKPADIDHLEQFLYAQMTKDLTEAGFNLVSDPGPGVARIRVALTNLKKGTPALNVIPQTKMTGLGLGQASAEVEVVDSQNGTQFMAAIISQTGSRFSLSGLSSWGDVEAVMKDWSKRLTARLVDYRSRVGQ